MLKFILDNLDSVPEAMRSLYRQREDGKWILQVEGAVPAEKLAEFRDNNTKLLKDLEKFKDVDPVKYAELLKIETDLRNGKVKDGKTVEEIVAERTDAMKKAHEKQVGELSKTVETTTTELSRLKISDAAVAVATELGLRPTAREDLVGRVTQLFRLKDGKPVAVNPDGSEIYGSGAEPLSIKEYVGGLVEKAPHLFEASQGSGAHNNGKPPIGGRITVNPWKKETWNVTKQGQLFKENKELARKMAAEAGHKIPEPAAA